MNSQLAVEHLNNLKEHLTKSDWAGVVNEIGEVLLQYSISDRRPIPNPTKLKGVDLMVPDVSHSFMVTLAKDAIAQAKLGHWDIVLADLKGILDEMEDYVNLAIEMKDIPIDFDDDIEEYDDED